MKRAIASLVVVLFAAGTSASAFAQRHDEKPHGQKPPAQKPMKEPSSHAGGKHDEASQKKAE